MYRRNSILFSNSFIFQIQFLLLFIILPSFTSKEESSSKQNEDLFKKLFKLRRAEQLQAVKKMVNIEESKQLQMVKTMTKVIFEVMQKSRTALENAGYTPGVSDFPESEPLRDALSLVIENTALLGELVLRLPDATQRVLRSAADGTSLLAWGLTFAAETRLLDSSTSKLFSLVSQELNFTTRDPDFVNPYKKVKLPVPKPNQESEAAKKKKKKPSLPRGPRLTLRQEL